MEPRCDADAGACCAKYFGDAVSAGTLGRLDAPELYHVMAKSDTGRRRRADRACRSRGCLERACTEPGPQGPASLRRSSTGPWQPSLSIFQKFLFPHAHQSNRPSPDHLHIPNHQDDSASNQGVSKRPLWRFPVPPLHSPHAVLTPAPSLSWPPPAAPPPARRSRLLSTTPPAAWGCCPGGAPAPSSDENCRVPQSPNEGRIIPQP